MNFKFALINIYRGKVGHINQGVHQRNHVLMRSMVPSRNETASTKTLSHGSRSQPPPDDAANECMWETRHKHMSNRFEFQSSSLNNTLKS